MKRQLDGFFGIQANLRGSVDLSLHETVTRGHYFLFGLKMGGVDWMGARMPCGGSKQEDADACDCG